MSTTPATPKAYLALQQRGGVADLSDRTKLRLSGADRVRYLNGQVSNHITRLKPGESIPACVTTAKGKLSAEVFVTALSDSLLVDAPAELRETLVPRLERYIIADDVTLEDVTEEFALLHLLRLSPESLPELSTKASSIHAARRFGEDGWDLLLPRAAFAEWCAQPEASEHLIAEGVLEVLRIERGIPRWGHELDENTLPPEAGLDRTHIDYHKGCYIGQEVISRLRSVGRVNRELVGFTTLTEDHLAPAMRLFGPEEGSRQLGTITSATWSFALAKPIALGYLRRDSPMSDLIARPAHAETPVIHVAAQALPFLP